MIRYESAGRVGASAVRTILEEAGAVDRRWWRGGLGFDAKGDGRPEVLRGRTPLFHSHGVAEEDDLFMAFADALFIVRCLAGWAERFRIKWRVWMNDEDWGAVDPGGPTKPLVERMDKWAGRAGAARMGKRDWEVSEGRRADLLARCGTRR